MRERAAATRQRVPTEVGMALRALDASFIIKYPVLIVLVPRPWNSTLNPELPMDEAQDEPGRPRSDVGVVLL
jgi:hypothetical protein